jgi:serralysin
MFTVVDSGGTDTIEVSTLTADAIVDLRSGSFSSIGGIAGTMAIAAQTVIENLITGAGDDRVTGNGSRNRIETQAGDDTVSAGGGDDTVIGGGGRDRLWGNAGSDELNGGGLRDRLYGGSGHDRLNGNNGNDVLQGNKGRDVLVGGKGNDLLIGGAQADSFVFNLGDGQDRIRDLAGGDRILLDTGLLGGGGLADYAALVQGAVVFDFGGGDSLTLEGIGSIDFAIGHTLLV